MSEQNTKEVDKKEVDKPGVEFLQEKIRPNDHEADIFQTDMANLVIKRLRITNIRGLQNRWRVSVCKGYAVEIIAAPEPGGNPCRKDEHIIMRWIRRALDIPRTKYFIRDFNEYGGAFTWRYSDYGIYKKKRPGSEDIFAVGLRVSVANESHKCKLVKEEYTGTRYKADCTDDGQQDLKF